MAGKRYRTQLGPVFSEGARLLWTRMLERGWTFADLQEHIELKSRGTINRWMFGDRRPDLPWVLAIERAFGISPSCWYEPPLQPFAPPSEAA